MTKVEELKSKIEKFEASLKSTLIPDALKGGMKASLDKLKKELEELESKTEEKVEEAKEAVKEAEEKVEEAKADGTKAEVKKAEAELKEAVVEKKEAVAEVKAVEKIAEKIEKVADKVEVAEKKHGGARPNAGRKEIPKMALPKMPHGGKRPNAGRKVVASSPTKLVKPKGAKVKLLVTKKKAKEMEAKKMAVRKAISAKVAEAKKPKSVRAFGQIVEYKNDAEFCSQLIKAFKKRRALSKKDGVRRKTKPVFGAITTSVKNAVSKALHSVSTKQIEKNPKEFLAKATRLEKSAIRFLEDFKAILGSDYKKAEIASEFGELEKSIKLFVAKHTKK